MAHFAKLTENNTVSAVLNVSNNVITDENNVEQESLGQQHLQTHHNWPANLWIHQHTDGGTPFRGNYAGIGFTWDSENEIFWPLQPYASWTKNNTTASWDPPVAEPEPTTEQIDQIQAGTHIWNTSWDEATQSWDILFTPYFG